MLRFLFFAFTALCSAASASAQVVPDHAEADVSNQTLSRALPELAHIGIVVEDAAAAVDRTITQLGLDPSSVITDLTYQVTDAHYRSQAVDYTVVLKIVETGNVQIEYLQPLEGPSPYADALEAAAGAVVHHLAYVVPSIDEHLALARRDNPGVEVVVDAPIADIGRFVYVDGVLPGVLVELIELNAPADDGN